MMKKIKFGSMILMAVAIFFGAASCKNTTKVEPVANQKFEINRGTNLSHWLSQDFGWEAKYTYIGEKDIRFIDSLGFDHVRLPIDEQEMWDESGKPIAEAFTCMNNCLDWCEKYGLRTIVDLHIVRAHHFNAGNEGGTNTLWTDETAQNNFVDIWMRLSDVLKNRENSLVAYEILNEAVAPDHDDWNKLMNKAVTAIRAREPERTLVIGANMWQIAPNLKFLKLPEGDKNIILSFHTYSPLPFTHYKANWTPLKAYTGPVHYPGQIITDEDYEKYIDKNNKALVDGMAEARLVWNKEKLLEVFKTGLEFARSKNLQLYCGEFGCMPTVDRKDRLAWYSDMIDVLEGNNVAWANWEYKGDFGLYVFDGEKLKSNEVDNDFIGVLLKNLKK
jgi:endoglucanase